MRSNLRVFLAMLFLGSARALADPITVYGGPTYSPGGGGFKDGEVGGFNGVHGTAAAHKFGAGGVDHGFRPLRLYLDLSNDVLQVSELEPLGVAPPGAIGGAYGTDSAGNLAGWDHKFVGGAWKGSRAVRWNAGSTAPT